MIAQLGAAFLMGFLAGMAACWKRLRCLRAKVRVFEYYFGERMKQQWDESAQAPAELRAHKVA